jgi:hypothetical protein
MEVTLYIALGVYPGAVKNHLGALEIILAFHEVPKSHPGAEGGKRRCCSTYQDSELGVMMGL